MKYRPLEDRFWEKVYKGDACWFWQATTNQDGYGQIALPRGNGKTERAHRISWILNNGPIPKGKHVLHKCDNPACVRPSHLFLGTHQDNMKDMARKGRAVPKPQNGELNDSAKLNNKKVLAIRTLLGQGITQKRVAAMYGVSRATICHISKRKTWAHL